MNRADRIRGFEFVLERLIEKAQDLITAPTHVVEQRRELLDAARTVLLNAFKQESETPAERMSRLPCLAPTPGLPEMSCDVCVNCVERQRLPPTRAQLELRLDMTKTKLTVAEKEIARLKTALEHAQRGEQDAVELFRDAERAEATLARVRGILAHHYDPGEIWNARNAEETEGRPTQQAGRREQFSSAAAILGRESAGEAQDPQPDALQRDDTSGSVRVLGEREGRPTDATGTRALDVLDGQAAGGEEATPARRVAFGLGDLLREASNLIDVEFHVDQIREVDPRDPNCGFGRE